MSVVSAVERSVEEDIKACGLSSGAAVVGIASVEDINRYAPEGHRPTDILTGARSVLVVGGPSISKGAWRSPNPRITALTRTFAAIRRNVAARVAGYIEEDFGYYAIFVDRAEESGHTPFISLKLCAEMAGLGTRSMAAGILLNRDHGLLNFSCVITTMPMKADGPLNEAVCPHSSCVAHWERRRTTPCLEVCPTCLSGEIEEGRIKWMRYERYLCQPRAQTTSTQAFQKMLLAILEEPDPKRRKMMVLGDFFTRTVRALAFSSELVGNCFECTRVCPIVRRARTLRPVRRKGGS